MLSFSAGRLFGAADAGDKTPIDFGALQSCSVDIDFNTKDINGKGQFPIFIARGAGKIAMKAEIGIISGKLFNNLFFRQTLQTGGTQLADDEAHSVPGVSPFTVSAANSATWAGDEGVAYANGTPLALTSGAPTASGQYEVAGGLYTFSSSDASAAILLDYLYTTTGGESIAINNLAMGTTPTFQAVFRDYDPKSGLYMTFVAYKVTCSKLSMAAKMGDFKLPSLEFSAMDNGAGQVGLLTFGDAA